MLIRQHIVVLVDSPSIIVGKLIITILSAIVGQILTIVTVCSVVKPI